ncbi:MAG: response regulator [Defluviitaleaceae bacterium]|nr:response regulator [Defluviitaleaceae bacterium]MCL2273785.1 response regulator [Defluviitaleaceae bacterium]
MKTIFLVDDNATNLTVAEDVLSRYYRVVSLSGADKMFTALKKFKPDLILLDVEMPEIDGFDAMRKLKDSKEHQDIPVIFLTAKTDEESEAHGIEMGAADFIMKPFSEAVFLNRIKHHLHVDDVIRERTEMLFNLKNGLVFAMADLVESRDKNTGGHIDRTSVYMQLLIEQMLTQKVYADEIRTWNIDFVVSASRLHDVGKILIPDSVLNKPDKLTIEEFEIMKTHVLEGERIIDNIIARTGEAEFLTYAKTIAVSHHEKWNGTGYPYGLKGEEIPLMGRVMAIVDVYDALISERPYKKAFSPEEAVAIIKKDAGTHFDPLIVPIFVAL